MTADERLDQLCQVLMAFARAEFDARATLTDGDDALDASGCAQKLGVRDDKLEPLLYALVGAGLLEERNGRFSNNAESREFLIKGRPRYLGSIHELYSDLWGATLHTAQSIRPGVPQARHDFSAMSAIELEAFVRGLDAGAGAAARRLDKDFDFSRFEHVLDAGGGAGALAVTLCRKNPSLRATVAELDNVAPIAERVIAESGLDDRIRVVACDLVSGPPPGDYDAIVMRAFLQVLSREDAASAVAHSVRSLRAGGELFAMSRMLDDSKLEPADAVSANVMFLNIYDAGGAYTESEYREWFSAAGLVDNQRRRLSGGYSIIKGSKPR